MSSDKPIQWQTPDGMMRKIRLRKQSNQCRRFSLSTPTRLMDKTTGSTPGSDAQLPKRKNPFAKKRPAADTNEVLKKRILSCPEYDNVPVESSASDSGNSMDAYSNILSENAGNIKKKCNMVASKNIAMPFVYLEEDSIQGIFTEDKTGEAIDGVAEIPMDWTIKRKARFLSKSSFSWCSRIKGAEEANSIANAARNRDSVVDKKPGQSLTPEALQRKWRVELGKCLTYWQQPSVPWLTLFPRYGNQQKLHQSGSPAIPQSDEVTKSFYDSWTVSFRSAYQLVRERLCPFFYVCSQQYTAIFRAATMSGTDEITCMLTPSTTGLRQSLQKEGVKFSLPLRKALKSNVTSPKNDTENKENEVVLNGDVGGVAKVSIDDNAEGGRGEDDIDEMGGEEDEETWEMISGKIQMNGVKELRQNTESDTSSRSAVLVSGNSNTQLLFNYLLNSRSSTSTSGVQANLPPTILAPVPFQGSSLQKLGVRSGVAKTYNESTLNRSLANATQHKFSLDITGPLLPHSIVGVTELLCKTQGNEGYEAAFSSSMYTAPFNTFGRFAAESAILADRLPNTPLSNKPSVQTADTLADNLPATPLSINTAFGSIQPLNENFMPLHSLANPAIGSKPAVGCDFGVSNKCVSRCQSFNEETDKNGCVCQVTCRNSLYSWKI